ncbi:DNA alkylation repair protein [Knoellia sinensis]|nr:DNA alkylation repair protein [Knoellia sinensis]
MALTTAKDVRARLEELASPEELAKVRKRLAPDEPAIGLRMKALFDTAKEAAGMPLGEVEALLDDPAYEPRLAAFCILDFKARKSLGSEELCEVYLRRHDRITTWDMVDRAAPRVVGGAVAGGPYDVLHELAKSSDPLRRRSAISAPLFFTQAGSTADLAEGFALAALLHDDPEPVVTNSVGIFLAYAGGRDRAELLRFLGEHGPSMPRPALRLAARKLPPAERQGVLAPSR